MTASTRIDFWKSWLKDKTETQKAQMLALKESQAESDTLTGLLNRRGLENSISTLDNISRRTGLELVLVFLDLDGLKEANDKMGYQEGDKLIKTVSSALQSSTRNSDIVGRWGGDEFVAVLTNDKTGAKRFSEKMKKELKEISISGVVARWDGKEPLLSLLEKAGEKMKEAKKTKKPGGRSKGVGFMELI